MKGFLYILFVILVTVSCNNSYNSESLKASDVAEEELEEAVAEVDDGKTVDYEAIAKQKLQEYVDLKLLQQQHPEFKSGITEKLEALSEDDIDIFSDSLKIDIRNISPISEARRLNDSVTELKLSFDIVSEKSTRRDTLYALILSRTIQLDGLERISTKMTFRRNKEER
ncbi:hypothetical protein [Constantimarinum furrinae]|uniref:Lipoprotein n=1 Tax=Constantimarinum furrinae TaxID=2562285 RepID=A0A7G8PUS2_9FLAO|nr:hypothetical protein [Constantimarinum furrinae]QNJ98088.1 hypothetical protein ALE3EI_1530 [Constantimarinum furrinae]